MHLFREFYAWITTTEQRTHACVLNNIPANTWERRQVSINIGTLWLLPSFA